VNAVKSGDVIEGSVAGLAALKVHVR
jgi:hypothetical protein